MPRLLTLVPMLGLALGLAGPAAMQPVPSDADVRKGVGLVEEGDYDGAILLLDNASRRLAGDPARGRELSTAYLYLGIAYLGKGHEAAARSNFREAVSRLRDLSLSPEKFSPRIIDLVEAAKAEVGKAPPAPVTSPAPAARPTPASGSSGGGGGKKGLLIAGAVVLAGGGAAVALKGGGGGDDTCDTVFESREGLLRLPGDRTAELRAGPADEAGAWYAELRWRDASPSASAASSRRSLPTNVGLLVTEAGAGGRINLEAGLLSDAVRKAEWQGSPGTVYVARISLEAGGASAVTYTLSLGGPCQ
jgi:hypothetical protein